MTTATVVEFIDTDTDGSIYRRMTFTPSELLTVEVYEIREPDGRTERTFKVEFQDESPLGLHDLAKATGQLLEIVTLHV